MRKRWLMLLLLSLAGGPVWAAQAVQVAVAANFLSTVRVLAADFTHRTGTPVRISVGSTGKLYAQIENGAPYDVFLAADARRPGLLQDDGLTGPGQPFTYAVGQLVLWSPNPKWLQGMPGALSNPTFQRLAIANPQTAPYGSAARAVLERLGYWDKLQSVMVRGENIGQAFQFVATGNAQLGFVALSQVLALKGTSHKYWTVPPDLYEPINQQAVALSNGDNPLGGQAFLRYLRSPAARRIIRSAGYGLP
ncbi:MAG: molybdate ABC transporter substrate-binding protein [Gammaproteobacteria bacterium]